MFKTWDELSRKEQLECIFWDAYKDAEAILPLPEEDQTETAEWSL